MRAIFGDAAAGTQATDPLALRKVGEAVFVHDARVGRSRPAVAFPDASHVRTRRRSGTSHARLPAPSPMTDVLLIALTVAFFAASLAYLRACGRL